MTIAFKRINDHLESINISSCKFMELRGNYPKPVNWIKAGKDIIFCSKYDFELNKENFYNRKDFSTNIKASALQIHRGLLPWLEIAEPKFCFLASKVETTEILNLPLLPNNKGRAAPMLFGLAGKKSSCFINFIEEKTDDSDIKLFTLHVRSFGADEKLANQLLERITEWGNAGCPEIYNIKVKAFFDKSNIIPSKDEYLIKKKWVNLLFSKTKNK